MKKIEAEFGDMPISILDDIRTRGVFKYWRDTMARTPRTADYAWGTLARVLSFAKDRGKISQNVCEKGGRLYTGNRAEKIWTESHIAALLKTANNEITLALMLALWTGQREGDLLALPWSVFDGQRILLKQGKIGAKVTIPASLQLRSLLNKTRKSATTILINTRGLSCTGDGFRTSWGKAVQESWY